MLGQVASRIPRPFRAGLRMTRRALAIHAETWRDGRRIVKYGNYHDADFKDLPRTISVEAQMNRDYHRVEKALALRTPRRPFGEALRQRLIEAQARAAAHTSGDGSVPSELVDAAKSALKALDAWNATGVVDEEISPLVTRESIWSPIQQNHSEVAHFLTSRSSLRDFSTQAIPGELINKALRVANRAPSVCNRQAWKVHLYQDPDSIADLLNMQNGNGGFGHQVPTLAVITIRLEMFAGAEERNQGWIDGGIYLMSFLNALHLEGLGSCALNWSRDTADTQAFRSVAGIPDSEDVIALVAIGFPEDNFRIARSPRHDASSVLVNHNPSTGVRLANR